MQCVWKSNVGVNWKYLTNLPKRGDVDAVIINGEGTMHHSSRNQRALILAEIPDFASNTLGVPTFLINATLFENTSEYYESLRSIRLIFVRDSMSLIEIKKNGLDGIVVPDLTLAYQYPPQSHPRHLNISTDSVKPDVSTGLIQIAKKLDFHFCPIQYTGFRLSDIIAPVRLRRKIFRYLRESLIYKSIFRKHDTFLTTLRQSRFLISGRYHAVTMAILVGVPFVAVESNTPKISALLYDVFGSERRALRDLSSITEFSLKDLIDWSNLEKEQVDDFRCCAQRRVSQMFLTIRRSI